jgi:DNA-binding protein H-NS
LEENREKQPQIDGLSHLVHKELDPEATQEAQEDYKRMMQERGIGEDEALNQGRTESRRKSRRWS